MSVGVNQWGLELRREKNWLPETTGFERILHLDRRFPQPGRESPAVFGTENHRYVK